MATVGRPEGRIEEILLLMVLHMQDVFLVKRMLLKSLGASDLETTLTFNLKLQIKSQTITC